jgi:uncharacterized protein (TIGR00299 family) protein
MSIAYFDCFSGASGDMILGALVSAGLSADLLRTELAKLPIDGYRLAIDPVRKQSFAATQVRVEADQPQTHRHLHHIKAIIEKADKLPATVRHGAMRVFTRLAEAEAKVHGTSIEKVHFHEVGAVDAIVDVVGAMIGVHHLGLDHIVCSPIPTGHGSVQCEHGLLPVPAPATAELLVGVPIAACDEPGELTTPTGAAILTGIAQSYGPPPAMTLSRIGLGAGTRDGKTRPNFLRLLIGESASSAEHDEVVVLEANLDDVTGEQIGSASEALFAAGALDVFTIPAQMKKNRPGLLLTVLAEPHAAFACEEAIFTHTTTFGVRRHACTRRKLARSIETVQTRFGPIRIKVGRRQGRVLIASPEYEDCQRVAASAKLPLREVMFEAQAAWRLSADGARGQ